MKGKGGQIEFIGNAGMWRSPFEGEKSRGGERKEARCCEG